MPQIEVYSSCIIPAVPERVWSLLRDFDAMPQWNAAVRSSRIEAGPSDRIGCRRVLTFDDGGVWTHELTGLSNPDMTLSYAIVDGPAEKRRAVHDYSAIIRVECVTEDDSSFVAWRAKFWSDSFDMRERATAVFQAGFDGLKRKFSGRP